MNVNKIKEAENSLNEIKKGFLIDFGYENNFNNFTEVIDHAILRRHNDINLNPTFYSKSKKLQCICSIGRGIGDLYRLCKNYFPNTTLEEVIMYLKNNKHNKRIQYCGTTKQTVIRKETYAPHISGSIIVRGKSGKQFDVGTW